MSCIIEWIEQDANGGSVTPYLDNNTADPKEVTFRYMISHGSHSTSSGRSHAISRVAVSGHLVAHNGILYDHEHSADVAIAVGFSVAGNVRYQDVFNYTIHDIRSTANNNDAAGIQSDNATIHDVRNVIITDVVPHGTGTGTCFLGSADKDHNASSDTSADGTGSLTSIVTADQFVSIIGGSIDLHLKLGADVIGAGIDLADTPTGIGIDIDNRDRDQIGIEWDIGASQFSDLTLTIGTTGRDFSTITLWEAALVNYALYDITGEMYNDSVFDEGFSINDTTPDSIVLTVASGERHDGSAGTGTRVVMSTNKNTSNTKAIRVEWLEIDFNEKRGGSGWGMTSSGDDIITSLRMIVHGNHEFSPRGINSGNQEAHVLNCIVYNIRKIFSTPRASFGIRFVPNPGRLSTIMNCTSHDITHVPEAIQTDVGISMNSSGTHDRQNNLSTGVPEGICFSTVGTGDDDHNASEDSTAPGPDSLINITTVDQYVSIVIGSEDLHLKTGADVITAGIDLETTPTGVEIDIDGRDRDAQGDLWDIGADLYVGLNIIESIGTDSRDFSTITLWEANLVNHIKDTVTGECYNDSVFDEAITLDDTTPDSYTLTVAVGERHTGVAGTGARIVRTTGNAILNFGNVNFKTLTLEWLEYDANGRATSSALIDATHTDLVAQCRNLLLHGTSVFQSAARGLFIGFGAAGSFLANSILYDMDNTFTGTGDVYGVQRSGGTFEFYNVTVHNIHTESVGSATCVIGADAAGFAAQNIIATDPLSVGGSEACYSESSYSTAIVDHNAASDTTASGTGSIDSIVTVDQYVSTMIGSEDLHLKAGSVCIGAGFDLETTPTGVEIDIDGRDRHSNLDVWDMGADAYVGVNVTSTIGTDNRDFSTMTLWAASLANLAIKDNAIGECYNDSVFDESVTVDDTTPNSKKLTVAANERHDGIAGTGVRMVASVGGRKLTMGTGICEWIVWDINGFNVDNALFDFAGNGVTFQRMIGHDVFDGAGGSGAVRGFRRASGDNTQAVHNCILYDLIQSVFSGSNLIDGIETASQQRQINNNTLYNFRNDGNGGRVRGIGAPLDDTNSQIQNNIVIDCNQGSTSGTKEDFEPAIETAANTLHRNNLSGDATAPGPNSLINKTAADNFESTVGGSEDLHLRAGADALATGVAIGPCFGTAAMSMVIDLTGIASAEAFGTANLARTIVTTGIATAEGVGSPNVADAIRVNGIPSEEAFGTAAIQINIIVTGIPSAEAFGLTNIQLEIEKSMGIPSEEVFGIPILGINLRVIGGLVEKIKPRSPFIRAFAEDCVKRNICNREDTAVVAKVTFDQLPKLLRRTVTSGTNISGKIVVDNATAPPEVFDSAVQPDQGVSIQSQYTPEAQAAIAIGEGSNSQGNIVTLSKSFAKLSGQNNAILPKTTLNNTQLTAPVKSYKPIIAGSGSVIRIGSTPSYTRVFSHDCIRRGTCSREDSAIVPSITLKNQKVPKENIDNK